MRVKTAVDFLTPVKFILDWFTTSKTQKKFHDALLANDYEFFFGEDFSNVTFFANKRDNLSVGLHKINLDSDNNFYEDDPKNVINVRLLTWGNKFEKPVAKNECL